MTVSGGSAELGPILGLSFFSGLATAAMQHVTAWLGDISPGGAALIGTVAVGVFGVLVRESVGLWKWHVERRERTQKGDG